MKPDSQLIELVQRYVDGEASQADMDELDRHLRKSAETRSWFLEWMNLDSALGATFAYWEEDEGSLTLRVEHNVTDAVNQNARLGESSYVYAILATAASLIILASAIWWLSQPPRPDQPIVAKLVALQDARWTSSDTNPLKIGDALSVDQQLKLSTGSAQIKYSSGASVMLYGPTTFKIESENSGFLPQGRLSVDSTGSRSQGFNVRTPNANIFDQGAKYYTSTNEDGQSHIEVATSQTRSRQVKQVFPDRPGTTNQSTDVNPSPTVQPRASGSVEVELPNFPARHRILAGNALGVEPGNRPVLVHIERGDSTPAFRFATIEPPSNSDYADASRGFAQASIPGGTLHEDRDRQTPSGSGPVEQLLDGRAQRGQDVPHDSVFFKDGTTGVFLVDLGKTVSIKKVNTYSWHQHPIQVSNRVRAAQKYTLWAFAGDRLPSHKPSPADGWVRIASVNSDEFFEVTDPMTRPAQQAISIRALQGDLGRYRYLLFAVQPTRKQGPNVVHPNHTFYGEFDVYVNEKTKPTAETIVK